MRLSEQDEINFQNSTQCHICERNFTINATDINVRDHCHLSGKYRDASCQSCNLNFKYPTFIPVFCHGFSHFDSHIVCQGLGKFKKEKIKCIAKTDERYTSISLGNLRFLDSYQFLDASLEKLTNTLKEDGGVRDFRHLQAECENVELLLRKGVYPYSYMDSFSRFEETCLPPLADFYIKLTKSNVSDRDYRYAQEVWTEYNIRNMGEYHDLYLKTDVLLLADVFEHFRRTCLQYYKLDPAHFFTLPGLAWQAALRMSKVELELMTDSAMYLFFENAVRGGLSMITHNYAKANNPLLESTFNPRDPHSYIVYQDCTNLYGKAMSMKLPHKNFQWLSDDEIESLDITISDDADEGYALEVDLHYPKKLHDLHSDYPLAPEKIEITNDMLSPRTYQQLLDLQRERGKGRKRKSGKTKLERTPCTKLTASLHDKKRYILHYRNLKTYLRLGLKLKKILRVVRFTQTAWLKTYIDFNTQKRRLTQSEFLRSFFKLLNNAVFGKTLENIRTHQNFKLVNNKNTFKKEVAKPSFDHFNIFSEDLVGMSHKKTHLLLYIACGMAILSLSKLVMYAYYYDHLKKLYKDKVKFLATDTDSLIVHVETPDVYADMQKSRHLYDFSNYPKDHPLFSEDNKGVLGTFKDETHSLPIAEFVGLRSKLYAFVCPDAKDKPERKTAKGIQKATIEKNIMFEDYKQCLFEGNQMYCNFDMIRSRKHQLHVCNVNKKALCSADDKRWTLNDGITTLAYGHYSTLY